MIKLKYFILLGFICHMSFSQNNDDVLLTVNGDAVTTSEFLSVYRKNLDLVKDENQKNVDSYLDLFIEYQLKLKEAKRLKLDENQKYKNEFSRYRKQLAKNYLNENKVTEALVKEAYERTKTDVNVSHILIRLDEATKDTLNVYNRLLQMRDTFKNEAFETTKQKLHNGKTVFVEDLKYFSVFRMVYDFESMAYKTPVGEVSMPFRTQFGYHILKVNDKRLSKGTLHAAHIMVAHNQKDSLLNPEQRINEIYKKLKQGETFEALARQFSDDKSSAKNDGQIKPFKSGQLGSLMFENKAFALENDNDITQPFKTRYGWHIVKRLRLDPILPFEDLKPDLQAAVKKDSRSKVINKSMVKMLKARYKVNENEAFRPYFESIIDSAYFKNTWKIPSNLTNSANVFTINDKAITYGDFAMHLKLNQRNYFNKNIKIEYVIDKEFESFFENKILQYRKDNLEDENPEFAAIVKEYRDGLLLFDLLEKEIWNKASKDSVGLENYYNKNKTNYTWKERAELLMATSNDKAILNDVATKMKAKVSQDSMNTHFNTDTKQNVIFTKGIYETTDDTLPENLEVKTGVSKIYNHNNTYHVINILNVQPPTTKTLEEARGNVINDYQQQLERNWVDQLKKRYKVTINKSALKSLKRALKQ